MKKNKQDILNQAIWFDKTNCEASFFAELQPQRQVSYHPRYKSGTFFSDKCKKDIQHESDLEKKFFIDKLEKDRKVLYYWEQPVKVPYWRGKIKTHTTPDVAIILKDLKVVIVEVKPLSGMLDYKVQMKVEGLLQFCANNGCGFLFTDGKETLDKIRKVRCNRKLESHILKAVDGNILRKEECKIIMDNCNATQMELLKVIFKHGLKYRSFPFKLQEAKYKNDLFYQVFYEKKKYNSLIKEQFTTLFKYYD